MPELQSITDHINFGTKHLEDVHSIFVGDSISDLLAMLSADLGIIMGITRNFRHMIYSNIFYIPPPKGSSQSLQRVLDVFNISVRSLLLLAIIGKRISDETDQDSSLIARGGQQTLPSHPAFVLNALLSFPNNPPELYSCFSWNELGIFLFGKSFLEFAHRSAPLAHPSQ